MSKKTRFMSVVLSCLMILSAFTACTPSAAPSSSAAPPSSTSGATPAGSEAPAKEEKIGNYPIATPENPLTLKVWSEMSDIMAKNVKTFEEVYAFQLQEKATGVKIQWEHGVAGQSEEVFNLMLASGDLPDLIRRTIGDPTKYPAAKFHNEGIIIDFAPYLEYAPNFARILDENVDLKKQLVDDEGQLLFFPTLQLDLDVRVYRGFMIREDWCEQVDKKVPTNTDELYEVLKAWKDANINGGSAALYSANKTDKSDFMLTALLWPFGVDNKFMLKDGQIVFGPTQPEYKEGMEYIRKLYAEGLIDTEYLVNDNAQWEAKFLNGEAGAAWGIASRIDKFNQNVDGAKFVPVPRLDGPGGRTFNVFDTGVNQYYKTNQTVVITTANKHIPETMMWMDWVFSPEGEEAFALGEEGLTYTMVDGKAQFTDLITKDEKGRNQNEVHILYAPGGSQWPCNVTREQIQVQKTPTELAAFETFAANIGDLSRVMPPLSLTEAEISSISSALNDIQTESYTWFDNLTLGKATVDQIDSEYLPRLYQMGLQEVLDAYNAAYQRYLSR